MDIIENIVDELYTQYEAENSLQCIMHGTFSENNSYEPKEPEPLMTRSEFIQKLNTEPASYRWNTAFQVLYTYISAGNKFAHVWLKEQPTFELKN